MIKKTLFAMGLTLPLVLAQIGLAEDRGTSLLSRDFVGSHPVMITEPDVMLTPSGDIRVRGAKVTGVAGTTLEGTTSWGSFTLPWTVVTDSNTQVYFRDGNRGSLGIIQVGHVVSFKGVLDTSQAKATVKAAVVRDWSVDRPPKPAVPRLFENGSLKLPPGATKPTSMAVTFNGSDYTVTIAADTAVLDRNWARVNLADFKVGQTIRVYGIPTGTTIDATVVRNIGLP